MSARTRKALTERRARPRATPDEMNYGKWALILGVLGAGFLMVSRKASASENGNLPNNTAGPTSPLLTSGAVGLPIQAGTQNIPELPATMAPTGAEIGASGSFWDSLTAVAGPGAGYINFPSGAQAAAALFPMRMDSGGNYYVQWAGLVYLLGSQDGSGNWPAQAVG